MSLSNFIKHFSIDLWKQYAFERFFNGEKRTTKKRESDDTAERLNLHNSLHQEHSNESIYNAEEPVNPLSNWKTIAELPSEHPAKIYVQGRRIPEVFYHELYYTDDLRGVFKAIPRYSERVPKQAESALLIPFFDDSDSLQFLQARVLDPGAKKRYQTFQITDNGTKIWGLDRVNWNQRVWVFEGPIDAMMVNNGIAVAGGTLTAEIKYLTEKCKAGFVFVFDNDYKTNYEVFYHFKKSIDANIPVVFFDKYFTYKDVNEAIQDGWSRELLYLYLCQNVKQGLTAQLALSEFKQPTKK